jgi:hypothetical protein
LKSCTFPTQVTVHSDHECDVRLVVVPVIAWFVVNAAHRKDFQETD